MSRSREFLDAAGRHDQPLPVAPGEGWYRMRYLPRSGRDISSAPFWGDPKYREEEARKPGLSASGDPHALSDYLHNNGWMEEAEDKPNRHVIEAFTGLPRFRRSPMGYADMDSGTDGEPLVVPTHRRDRAIMSVQQFQDRLNNTDELAFGHAVNDNFYKLGEHIEQHHHIPFESVATNLRSNAFPLHETLHTALGDEVSHPHDNVPRMDHFYADIAGIHGFHSSIARAARVTAVRRSRQQ